MTAPPGTPCPACGAALAPNARFCVQCGRRVDVAAPQPEQPAPLDRPRARPAPPPPGNRTETSAHLRIHVQIGTFADQQAALVAQRLEALIAALSAVLGVPSPGAPIAVYLGDLLPDPTNPDARLTAGSYAVPERGEVWSVFRPDAPGVDLDRTLVRLLVLRHAGRDPGETPLLLDGIVGLVGQRLGFVPPANELARMLAGAIAAGAPVAALPLFNGPAGPTAPLYAPIAASFCAYLVGARGAEAFLKLLALCDPQDPRAGAQAAFGVSGETLEKRWLQTLRRAGPAPSGIGRFLRQSWRLLRPYRRKQAEILLYVLFGIAFGQALPFAQRYLVDSAFPHLTQTPAGATVTKGSTSTLFTLLIVGLVVFLLMAGASLRQSYVNAQISEGVMRNLRTRMFSHLQDLSADYYSRTATGDILSRMTNDLFAVDFALSGALMQGLVLVLTFAVSLCSLLYLNWQLTLMALVILPLFYLITRFLGPPASRASRERQEQFGQVTSALQENIAAQPVVRAYGLRNTFVREYVASIGRLYQSAIRVVFLSSLFGLSANLLTTLIQVLVLGIGGYFVIQGDLSLGSLFAFLALLGGLISPAQSLSGVVQALQQATGAMDRVNEVLDAEPRVADKPGASAAGPLRESLAFEAVTFSYTGAEPQLHEVSFTIQAGASVAFVGPSGSGKSTVANLAARFYDPDRGSVHFDGADVRALALDSVRAQIGIVFQDSFLFDRSVRENIRFGREGATDAEVEAAARGAEVHDFILGMPYGYDTPVGERGANLSGGQRQRIAIARAILRDPSLLILDEATSALDPRTENAINHTLAALSQGRTTITITHRLASVATADRIFVLDRGRLVEEGTHAELLAAGGLYARLCAEQDGGAEGAAILARELDYLRRVPILGTLDDERLAFLAARLTAERFDAGDVLIRAGDSGDKLYVIVRGEAVVHGKDAAGRERELAVLGPGDYCGEIALLSGRARTATVRSRTPLTVRTLDRAGFWALLESTPGLRQALEQAIAQRTPVPPAPVPPEEAGAFVRPPGSGPVLVEGPQSEGSGLFVAPWRRGRAHVVLQDGSGRAFPLDEAFVGIGRNSSNAIVLPDRRISGFHARIERDPSGRYLIADSGSTNGTKLNGERIRNSTELHDGAAIELGGTLLRFEAGA